MHELMGRESWERHKTSDAWSGRFGKPGRGSLMELDIRSQGKFIRICRRIYGVFSDQYKRKGVIILPLSIYSGENLEVSAGRLADFSHEIPLGVRDLGR